MDRGGGSRRGRAVAALVVAVAAISFAAILFRKAMPTHPLVMAGTRLGVAAALLAPSVVRSARRGRMTARVWRASLVAGLIYGVHFGAWVTSLTLTTVAASVTLVTAMPILLAAFALITKRDVPEGRHFVAIALALVGVLLIGGHDLAVTGGDALLGDALALVGAAAMATYLLVVRAHGEALPVWAFSAVACAVGSVALLGTATLAGIPIVFPSTEAFLFIVLAALVPQLLGHGLMTWSLRHLRPTVVALSTVAEPVGATFLAWLWLGELVSPLVALGCAITLAAVALSLVRPGARRRQVNARAS